MQDLDVTENAERTPIEVALGVDKDGFTTAKKLYQWLELDESHYSRWVSTNILENPFAEKCGLWLLHPSFINTQFMPP